MTGPTSEPDSGRVWRFGTRDKDPSRLIWPILLAVAIVAVLGYCAAKPAYRAIKSVRAAGLAKSGEAQLAAGNVAEAGRSLKLALGLSPRNTEVLRLAARFCTYTSRPDALNYWQMLVASPDVANADKQQFILYCQDIHRFDLSSKVIEALLRESPNDKTTGLLEIEQALLVGNFKFASDAAAGFLSGNPEDPDLQFAYARAALMTRDRALAPKAIDLLIKLAHGKTDKRMSALRTLASVEALPMAEADWAAGELKGGSNPPFSDALLAYDVLGRAHPEKRLEYLREVAAYVTPNGKVNDISAAIAWLRLHGSPALAMSLISDTRAATNEPLTVLKMELLGAQGRWQQIEAMAALTNSPLSGLSKASIGATLAMNRGDEAAADAALHEAQRLAGNRLDSLEEVSRLAFALGRARAGLEIASRLLADNRTRIYTAEALLRIARKRDDYEVERLVFHNVSAEFGSAALIEKAYVDLLGGADPVQAARELSEMLKAQPDQVSFRAVAAFALLKEGKAEDAVKTLESAGVDWQQQEARWQLVHALALQASQMKSAARTFAAKISPSALRGPERDLLRTLSAAL